MLTVIALMSGLALAAPSREELPKFWDEYPIKVTEDLFATCMEAGAQLKLDLKKTDAFCTCHIFVLTETTHFAEFDRAKKDKKLVPLFERFTQMCISMGYSPGEPQKKPKQKPKAQPSVIL